MRILMIGDIVGRSGREALEQYLPDLKSALAPDIVVVNGDNAAHGFGITAKICQDFYALGVDCITGGNHIWDQREILARIDGDPKLLRPLNYPKDTQGRGVYRHSLPCGRTAVIVHLMGRVFMEPLDDPFAVMDGFLARCRLGSAETAIVVDFHAEASSEKMAFAYHMNGRVSAVVGSHTHVPSADARILDRGTAYQTDMGMTGDYASVIGFRPDLPIHRFVRKTPSDKLVPASGPGSLCGTFICTNDKTGLAESIRPVRIGVGLENTPLPPDIP